MSILIGNKKVLLRERKRHPACRTASTRYAVPNGGTLRGLFVLWMLCGSQLRLR